MDKLCFASYGRAIELGMAAPDREYATMSLFHFMLEKDFVTNRNGKKFDLQHRDFDPWWDGVKDVNVRISKHADNDLIVEEAPLYFYETIIPDLLNRDRAHFTYEELYRVITADTIMEPDTKDELKEFYEDGQWHNFLARAFLYAIVQPNESVSEIPATVQSLTASVDMLLKMIKDARPERIAMPEDIEPEEQKYVEALLEVYAQDAKVTSISKDDLDDYPAYRRNFERQRKDYFAAESIRRSARDILLLDETDELGFKGIKDETYEAIIEVYEDDYDNGYERLKAVLKHVTTITLSRSVITKLSGWVGASEKKGVCHILVNDGMLNWVDIDG